MANPPPATDHDRQQVRDLHAAGQGRNDIAKAIGRSPSTVSKIASELGITFDRSTTAAATEAKQQDNKARRAAIVARLYQRAEHVLDTLESSEYPFTATTVNGIETQPLGHVPAQDERHLSSAISANLTSAAKLEQIDADDQAAASRSMLGNLAAVLGVPTTGADE